MVNKETQKCLDVDSWFGEGDVGTYYCTNEADQRWTYNDGMFFNQASPNNCLTSPEKDAQTTSIGCSYNNKNTFDLVKSTFGATTANWRQVSCNQAGGIEMTLSSGISQTISETEAFGVEMSMSTEISVFGTGAEISTSASYDIEKSFENSWEQGVEVTQSCDYL